MYWGCEIMFVSAMTGAEKFQNLTLKLFFHRGTKKV